MTPATKAERIQTRRLLAAYAAAHKWTTTEPDPGRWWVVLELWHPWHHVRITVRWIDDLCTAVISDQSGRIPHTWRMADTTPEDIRYLTANPHMAGSLADAITTRPVIDLRETA